MYTYIKREIPSHYFRPEEPLTEENYGSLGSTWQDYVEGKFVPLNEEQIAFAEEHPDASLKEVFDMQLFEPIVRERTVRDAIEEKLREITIYDNGPEVNLFTINKTYNAWFTPAERSNYKQSVEAAKLMGIDTLLFFVGDILLEVETEQANFMLAAIQLYADTCFIITKLHKLAVQALETIEEVESYDFTVGYPKKLNFTI